MLNLLLILFYMDITAEIDKYINQQNREVWNLIKEEYSFRLLLDTFEYSWQSNVENGVATIIANSTEINYSAFTHEILHIYIDYLGMTQKREIVYGVIERESFDVLLENDLISCIYNFCSHKKMFPYFKEMGFSEYNFVEERINFTYEDLNLIRYNFSKKETRLIGVNQIIGHSLSLLNNVVEEDKLKCTLFLEELQSINQDLFIIIEKFDDNWNYTNDLNFTRVFMEFVADLDEWLIKEFVK